jgi:hypothetical protein
LLDWRSHLGDSLLSPRQQLAGVLDCGAGVLSDDFSRVYNLLAIASDQLQSGIDIFLRGDDFLLLDASCELWRRSFARFTDPK